MDSLRRWPNELSYEDDDTTRLIGRFASSPLKTSPFYTDTLRPFLDQQYAEILLNGSH